MLNPETIQDTGSKVGLLLSLAEDINLEKLNEMIGLTDHPLAKIMMPVMAQQLKEETGMKTVPLTELTEAMKLTAFFLAELKKLNIGDILK
jgi:hypothetical protein